MIRCLFLLALSVLVARAEETVIRSGVVLRSGGGGRGRSGFPIDPVAKLLVTGQWTPPTDGQPLSPSDTERMWRAATASGDGAFTNRELQNGYLDSQIESGAEAVRLLSAAGQDVVYVNGEPHAGDPYSNGILELPVQLHYGVNDFLFHVGRGRLHAKLSDPAKPILLYTKDLTLPDIVHGQNEPQWAAAVVINCTTNFLKDLVLRASVDGRGSLDSPLPSVPPLSTRKVGFRFKPRWSSRTNRLELGMQLFAGRRQLDTAQTWLNLRHETDHYNQTFISETDGSVQYYAIAPARPLPGGPRPRALVLTLHGAGVEATGQAGAYQSKSWATIAAATNRRNYGFDWEDWGQRDAIEVLDHAMKQFDIDPNEVYLAGHSMGGHGTWHVGVTYPGRFAAIAPSAGWISFWSYGGARRATNNDMERLLTRASDPGDTMGLVSNCLHFGVYILHGADDDNVPVTEARAMRDRLSQFHHDFMYHEQPKAGHWWGNLCVDWPPLFDFFARHRLPDDADVCDINFTTMNPGVSASSHWITIEEQQHPLEKSGVIAHYEPLSRAFEITTENVTRFALRPNRIAPTNSVQITLDGQAFKGLPSSPVWFESASGKWALAGPPSPARKGPNRYGPFKEAFGHRMIFVYGTKGSASENAWAAAKSRFDAETWWYRGNGAVDVVADADFDPAREPDRGVVLYGNADNNSSWAALLGGSPVQVHRGAVEIGTHVYRGDDVACLFCRPRPGSGRACVAVVSGTGVVGQKLTDRVPYISAGVAYPDCTVFGTDTLSKGTAGVRAAGFFGMDWGVASGDFVWNE
ncbi:MAG TPA: prolyl oligopeptidase family serine peptidase [Verrucomicrobiae bacterium]|jgi:poly(3-hydroxybutyrate) depolymerase